jgi:hypothetical protein
MYVTRHSPIGDLTLREQLWTLYRRAYAKTAEDAVTHEMLDRLEFDDQVMDPTNRAWVVWEGELPIAMTLVATDVKRTRWLSELYFKKHFPDKFASGRIHYIVWAVIDPAWTTKGASLFLARHAMAVEAREGALLVFDMPEDNQPHATGGAAELMTRMARMVGEATLVPLTVQRYYALDFSPTVPSRESESEERASATTS